MSESEYRRQVDSRSRQMLEAMRDRGACNSMWTAHALLDGGGDAGEVSAIVERGLNEESGPFQIFSALMLLVRWEDRLEPAAVDRIRQLMTSDLLMRGNTENHWLMYYVGSLLGAERWADEELLWNGLPPEVLRDEASRWILGMIARTAVNGHYEYDSTGYIAEHCAPYIALADHAGDPHMRHQAEQMLALLVADMALEYFHGAWAGGHSREGYRENTKTHIGPVQGLHYLYFGDEDFDPDRHCQGYVTPALTARYRPPAVLAALALDRREPRVVKKTKAPRSIYRHVDRTAVPVRKYTYLTPSFALGSTQVGLPGAPAAPIDLVSWDLSWLAPDQEGTVVCNHPYRGAGRFSAFLPGLPHAIGRSISSDKPYLQYPDRLFGASPYERMMQHEGAILLLYSIPADDDSPYLNIFLPKSLDWCERDGWILADVGEFHLGLRPLGPYRWLEIREGSNANIMVRKGNLIDGWLLRVDSLQPGLVLEAVEADEAGGFDAYCRRRSSLHLDLNGWPGEGRIAVHSFRKTRLEMHYDGPHLIDGKAVDYEAYPLYEAPGVEAALGTGRMCFEHGDDRLELDFGADRQTPQLPMRVIG